MTVAAWLLAALGVAGAASAHVTLARFAVTKHGPNPYTLAAAFNVLRLSSCFERALALVHGAHTSCFRSALVNAAAGGVKPGPKSPNGSRHLRALALDIVPGNGVSLDDAMSILHAAALRGELGPVIELIKETKNGIVHVSWAALGEALPHAIALREQTKPPPDPVYVPYTLKQAA